jgi:hypothetical protein
MAVHSRIIRLETFFVTSPLLKGERPIPITPNCSKAAIGFRLLPFRSPLLRECRLVSFPPGTEMFHFPGFASSNKNCWMLVVHHQQVTPFGDPGINGCSAPPPGLSQPSHVLHRLHLPRHPPLAFKLLLELNFITSALHPKKFLANNKKHHNNIFFRKISRSSFLIKII